MIPELLQQYMMLTHFCEIFHKRIFQRIYDRHNLKNTIKTKKATCLLDWPTELHYSYLYLRKLALGPGHLFSGACTFSPDMGPDFLMSSRKKYPTVAPMLLMVGPHHKALEGG